jgi:hypothetical protein
MENVGIFYGHLEYIMAIWYILQPFGIFYSRLVILGPFDWYLYIFHLFGILHQEYICNLVTLLSDSNPQKYGFAGETHLSVWSSARIDRTARTCDDSCQKDLRVRRARRAESFDGDSGAHFEGELCRPQFNAGQLGRVMCLCSLEPIPRLQKNYSYNSCVVKC